VIWPQNRHYGVVLTGLRVTGLRVSVYVFGRPFIKRFALCYQTVVYLSVLSVLSCLWRSCTEAKRLDGSRWNLARR